MGRSGFHEQGSDYSWMLLEGKSRLCLSGLAVIYILSYVDFNFTFAY